MLTVLGMFALGGVFLFLLLSVKGQREDTYLGRVGYAPSFRESVHW